MPSSTSRFFASIPEAEKISSADLVEYFVYFLTEDSDTTSSVATASMIDRCFKECDLKPSSRTKSYLSEGAKSKPVRYVRHDGGYKLERYRREKIASALGGKKVAATHRELRALESRLAAGPSRDFLKETIDCFEIGAHRAAVIMCWLLTVDHLSQLTFKRHLSAFNAVLAKNTDKRVKITQISTRDDFSEMPEGKLIEFIRSAGVISNDVRKILEDKLGTRNSCAHPSGVRIKESKVIDFIEDLIENVLLKYAI